MDFFENYAKDIFLMQDRQNLIPFENQGEIISLLSQYLVLGPCREIVDYVGVFPEIKLGAQFDVQDVNGHWYPATITVLNGPFGLVHFRNWYHLSDERITDIDTTSRLQLLGLVSIKNLNLIPIRAAQCYQEICACIIKCPKRCL